MFRRTLFLALVCCATALPPQAAAESAAREIAVLDTTDSSSRDIGESIARSLQSKLQSSGLFSARRVQGTLDNYSTEALAGMFQKAGTDLLAFAYVDRDRVALFLFDINRPGRYIATSETFSGAPSGRLTDEWIDRQLSKAFVEMIKQYGVANFDLIPSTAGPTESAKQPSVSREAKNRMLFQELSKVQDGRVYLSANVGMARFSAMGSSASTVTVGGLVGIKLSRFRFEAGMDIFSYLLMHGNLRLQLPVGRSYLTWSIGASVSYIVAAVTQNRGFNPTFIQPGIIAGPALTLEIPLLGAGVRGDFKLLFGSSTIFVGTYGLSYAL